MNDKRPLVVVDPGHGGTDPGAVSPSGTRESGLNLTLAEAFKAAAASSPFDVVLLRSVDTFLTLEDRARLANEAGATAVLSFHCNAAEDRRARGFEVWTSRGQTRADRLATIIYESLEGMVAAKGRPDFDDGDPDREAQFFILRKTTAPAVLVEFGFVSNYGDEQMLRDPDRQAEMAECVRNAVEAWLEETGL